MRRFRVSLVFLIAVLAITALDLAVFMSLFRAGPGSNVYHYLVPIGAAHAIPFGTLALGVVPMASLLVLAAIHGVLEIRRLGAVSGFWIGFEAAGWLSVFLYMTGGSLAPELVYAYLRITIEPLAYPAFRFIGNAVIGWMDVLIFTAAFSVLVLPELLLATAGGWLAHRARVKVVAGHAT